MDDSQAHSTHLWSAHDGLRRSVVCRACISRARRVTSPSACLAASAAAALTATSSTRADCKPHKIRFRYVRSASLWTCYTHPALVARHLSPVIYLPSACLSPLFRCWPPAAPPSAFTAPLVAHLSTYLPTLYPPLTSASLLAACSSALSRRLPAFAASSSAVTALRLLPRHRTYKPADQYR